MLTPVAPPITSAPPERRTIRQAAAACVDRSRYADLGGAVAAPVSLAAIALAWYAPVSQRILVEPPATAHGVTIAWSAIATAALALTCAAMRDQWHRYTRNLHRLSSPHRSGAAGTPYRRGRSRRRGSS
jgi:hypothetical protein